MQKLQQSIHINAPREKVWEVMSAPATYTAWTKPFNEGGSRYEGDWNAVGSVVKFTGPDPETGKDGGMLAHVKESRKPEHIAFEHFGIMKDGVEDTTSEEVKKWTPAIEEYTLTEKDGGTQFDVSIDVADEYAEMFKEMWEKALAELKRLSEQ
jgi:uncharacterized protein YndB with AHSA1/START domain